MKFLFAKLLYNAYELQIKLSVLKRRFCLGNRPINVLVSFYCVSVYHNDHMMYIETFVIMMMI